MKKNPLEITQIVEQGQCLCERARKALESAPSDKIRELATRVPLESSSVERPLELVLAGQYSAGKSTILRVLTGRSDIAVGSDITTNEIHTYDWNGIHVVDTPGIHTMVRPDHDKLAYEAIAEADLLMFVVTNELFDSHLSEHFRKLAVDKEKADEMILVVNKMQREAQGNTTSAQEVKVKSLRGVLSPYTPKDVRTSFIDALAALASGQEQHEEDAEFLWTRSGMELFKSNLDDFIRSKGLLGRYSTPIYMLEQALQEALCSEASGDTDVDGLEELLLQRRELILNKQLHLKVSSDNAIESAMARICQIGRSIAELVHGGFDQKQVEKSLEQAQKDVEEIADETGKEIEKEITNSFESLEKAASDILSGELAKELLPRLAARFQNFPQETGKTPRNLSGLKKGSDLSSQLGQFLVSRSFNPNAPTFAGIFRLNRYSGTFTHEAIRDIGHFLGKSFRPWEAVRWTRWIANAGRAFAVVGTVLTFILQAADDAQAKDQEKDLREGRSSIRSGFNDAASALKAHFTNAVDAFLGTSLNKEIKEIDLQLLELAEMQQSRGQLFDEVASLLQETRGLISRLHSTVD